MVLSVLEQNVRLLIKNLLFSITGLITLGIGAVLDIL